MRRVLDSLAGSNLMVVGSILIVIASISAVIFAHTHLMSNINLFLDPVVNILSLASMLFAALAFLVAAVAFKVASAKPRLEFVIQPVGQHGDSLVLPVHKITGQILPWSPLSHWRIWVNNTGSASARYTVAELAFDDRMDVGQQLQDWVSSPYDVGSQYRAFRWYSPEGIVVHPNFPLELPSFSFRNGGQIRSEFAGSVETVRLKITLAADGYWKPPIEKFIKLDYSQVDYEMEDWIIKALGLPGPAQFTVPGGNRGGSAYYTSQLSTEFGENIPPTYDYLCSTRFAQDPNWKEKFDDWKAKGIVS